MSIMFLCALYLLLKIKRTNNDNKIIHFRFVYNIYFIYIMFIYSNSIEYIYIYILPSYKYTL